MYAGAYPPGYTVGGSAGLPGAGPTRSRSGQGQVDGAPSPWARKACCMRAAPRRRASPAAKNRQKTTATMRCVSSGSDACRCEVGRLR
jgi:hypothetical protein